MSLSCVLLKQLCVIIILRKDNVCTMALEIKKQQIFKRDPQLQSAWITFSVYLFVLLLGNCICTRTHVSEFAVFVGSVFVQQKSNVAHSRTYVYVTALGEHAYAVWYCMQAWIHRSMDSSCTCVRKQEAGPRRYMRLCCLLVQAIARGSDVSPSLHFLLPAGPISLFPRLTAVPKLTQQQRRKRTSKKRRNNMERVKSATSVRIPFVG